jgi:hypothetical protein
MVPRQFFALLERKRLADLEREHGPALIVTALITLLGGKKSKKAKVTDYMPSWKTEAKKEMPWEEQMAIIRGLHSALGGR